MRDWFSVKAIYSPVVPTPSLQLVYKMDNRMGDRACAWCMQRLLAGWL